MIFFSFMLLTPLLPIYLSETFQTDKEVIGHVLSGYVLMALLSRATSGYIVDNFPRKKVLIISYMLFAAFFAGYIIAGSLVLFAIVRTLHGAPFGATTVANSTVAIDVLHPARRAEGIGYYGLSNNIATAISPSLAIYVYEQWHNFDLLFAMAFAIATVGLIINSTVKVPQRQVVSTKQPLLLDRFFLTKGWSEGVNMVCFAFSYGVLATYLAIYGKEELGITSGTGVFFLLLSIGLILARIHGNPTLRKGRVVYNAALGITISLFGYLLFASFHNEIGYYGAALTIGFGNGHMFPAFQTMFINLASNEKRGTANASLLTSWDVGMGCGILLGGIVAEHYGYRWSFWTALIVNAIGVAMFYLYTRKSFERNKVR
ncbi:MAG: MFS transporter [Bacteroidales bacterium]|nr:MFS transporter [Bacteroidales bacterium]